MRVTVHFNLHLHLWSVTALEGADRGRVIMHTAQVGLRNVTTKYWANGYAKVIADGGSKRRVVAWMKGDLADYVEPAADARMVTYNPYRSSAFTYRDSGEVFVKAEALMFGASDHYARII